MNNKLLGLLLATVSIFSSCNTDTPPLPTNTIIHDAGENPGNRDAKLKWLDAMHRTAPDVSWQAIEYQNNLARLSTPAAQTRDEEEVFADGKITARWIEKGSDNQAGSVMDTYYDRETDMIYLIAAGGSFWKGSRDGSSWEVINQNVQLDRGLLDILTLPNGDKRIIASIAKAPHYSDDMGLTWTAATGFSVTPSYWSGIRNSAVLKEEGTNHIFTILKDSYYDDYDLYYSNDNGESFSTILPVNTNYGSRFDLTMSTDKQDVFFIKKQGSSAAQVFKWDKESNSFEVFNTIESPNDFTEQTNLAVFQNEIDTVLYYFNGSNVVKRSEDNGNTWTTGSTIPETPWRVGLSVSPEDKNALVIGAVECFVSTDGGNTINKKNEWWDYYYDVENAIHADIMHFTHNTTTDGQAFTLISNHGGLSISYDNMATCQNISLSGLNVGEFYDVRTDALDNSIIYGGTQDQGFQRGVNTDSEGIFSSEQIISGDYGHIAFSDNNQRVWASYPYGYIIYLHNPHNSDYTRSYQLDSDDLSVWIPPLMDSPSGSANEVYLAGGNANGGSGSHIIKLSYNSGYISATNLPFNFLEEAGQALSALGYSTIAPNQWYAATTNGRFFYSEDSGETWEQSINFVPEGHYLYGQKIFPSVVYPDRVFYAGSGYSNPGVYISDDKGETFSSLTSGMPSTMIFDLASNENETLLFAATEAGPYVYVFEDDMWYPLQGNNAPTQTYWSVEYVASSQTVRFGTHGRGIWDLQLEEVSVSTKETTNIAQDKIQIFPNPVQDVFTLKTVNMSGEVSARIFNIQGQLVDSKTIDILGSDFETRWNIQNLPKGNYIIELKKDKSLISKKLVKL